MSEIQSNLVPGSVWARTKKNGDVSHVTVLVVTNVGCSERVLEVNPHQVVFITEQLQILSMTPEQFLNGRVYTDIDTDVAATIQVLTSEQEDDDDDEEIDLDSIEVDEDTFAKMLGGTSVDEDDADSVEDDDNDLIEEPVVNTLQLKVGPHPIAADLERTFVGYTEAPYHTGDTLHTLRFELDGTLSLNNISDAFYPKDPNAIQTFQVSTLYETAKIEVHAYADTMLESSRAGDTAVVYLISEGVFRDRAEDTGVEQEEASTERGQSAVFQHVDESPYQQAASQLTSTNTTNQVHVSVS
jgi:hypothetical protein